MEKKGRVTAKLIILDSLLFILLLCNIWILVSVLFLNAPHMTLIWTIFTIPTLFILCILVFILGWRDMSAFHKILPCISIAAFIWVYVEQFGLPLYVMLIVSGLSCIALVTLTLRKLVSTS